MRVSQATLFLAVVGAAQAFTSAPAFCVSNAMHSARFMSEEAEAVVAEVATPAAPTPEPSGMRMQNVCATINSLTAENFSSFLSTMEPFLTNEAGSTIYAKSIRRIKVQAKALGTTIPEGFCAEANATTKKRAKQDAFIQTKEEERIAAEAEAAEAAAAVEETVDEPSVVEA